MPVVCKGFVWSQLQLQAAANASAEKRVHHYGVTHCAHQALHTMHLLLRKEPQDSGASGHRESKCTGSMSDLRCSGCLPATQTACLGWAEQGLGHCCACCQQASGCCKLVTCGENQSLTCCHAAPVVVATLRSHCAARHVQVTYPSWSLWQHARSGNLAQAQLQAPKCSLSSQLVEDLGGVCALDLGGLKLQGRGL
jgi:hypothetical protein